MNVQAVDVGDVHPSKYDRLIAMAKAIPAAATLVVHPCDESSLRGVVEATNAGLIEPTLVPSTAISNVPRRSSMPEPSRVNLSVDDMVLSSRYGPFAHLSAAALVPGCAS